MALGGFGAAVTTASCLAPEPLDSKQACAAADAQDPLRQLRDQFLLPHDLIYLDGQSLGPLPKAAAEKVRQTVEQEWGQGLVRSWNDADWFSAPLRLGKALAPLIGADADETIVTDGMSLNLFKLLVAACRLRPDRSVIVVEADAFPTDVYIADSVAKLLPHVSLRRVSSESVLEAVDSDTATVLLAHVDYRSCGMRDLHRTTAQIHQVGATVIWNLAHSAGALPVELSSAQADFAVGCGYKYLCGGPGAPGFVYVARRHLSSIDQPLGGWFAHREPFQFSPAFEPAGDIRRMLCGTPPILAYAALEGALEFWRQVDLQALRQKSMKLSTTFLHAIELLAPAGELICRSPGGPLERGSHLVLEHPHAASVMQASIAAGVVGDFRRPNLLRYGFSPTFNTFAEVWEAASRLARILVDRTWQDPRFSQTRTVT